MKIWALLLGISILSAADGADADKELLKKLFKEDAKALLHSTEHYAIYTNTPKEVYEEVGKHMEDLYRRFGKEFPFEEEKGATPFKVYLFAEHQEFVDFVRQNHQEMRSTKDDMIPPFYSDRGGGKGYMTLWDMKKSRAGIFWHEGTHQLVHERLKITRAVPIWFEEGLANYVGTQVNKMEGELWIWCADEYKKRMKELMKGGIKLSAILSADGKTARNINGFRILSWSVNYFLAQGDRQESFKKFLSALRDSPRKPFDEIVKEHLGDIDTLDKDWKAFVSKNF